MKTTSDVNKFLDELHQLCLKHGFYIRGATGTSEPILYEAYGDEKGFIAQGTSFSRYWLLRRK